MRKIKKFTYTKFLLVILGITFAFYFLLLLNLNFVPPDFCWNYSSIALPLLEGSIVLLLVLFLRIIFIHKRNFVVSVFCVFPLLLLLIIYGIQALSIYISGDFISVLALENIGEHEFLPHEKIIYYIFIFIVFIVIIIYLNYLIFKFDKILKIRFRLKNNYFIFVVFLPFIILSLHVTRVVPCNFNLSPISGLLKKFYNLSKSDYGDINLDEIISFTKAFPSKRSFNFGNGFSDSYPLHQLDHLNTKVPYKIKFNTSIKPNLIVIFSEGFPARAIDSYTGLERGITPNIDRFIPYFMKVNNYFNHTAATFRGIQGSLTSQYPYPGGHMPGGWNEPNKAKNDIADKLNGIERQSLADILNSFDYYSLFLSPHQDDNILNTMLYGLGFSDVFTFDNYKQILNREFRTTPFNTSQSIADREIFISLSKIIENLDYTNKNFFVSLYNAGTHAFLDSHVDGKKYGDGSNAALNRFHEFDYSLGLFLDFFFQSNASKNTILIITSDHAAHPEPSVRKAFDQDIDYEPYIVDNIPLLIYSPYLSLPSNYEVAGRTSLDLSPTLLHLLGLNGYDHSFMGESLFIKNKFNSSNYAALGSKFYHIKNKNFVYEIDISNTTKNILHDIRIIKAFYHLERENRLFDPTR